MKKEIDVAEDYSDSEIVYQVFSLENEWEDDEGNMQVSFDRDHAAHVVEWVKWLRDRVLELEQQLKEKTE